MRIPSGKTDQRIYFVAVDVTDGVTRETGLSGFTVIRSRNGAADVAYTTPTITEIDAATMPGVYALLVDEDTSVAAASDSEEYCLHITHASMRPVTRTIELYRRDTTSGQTITVSLGVASANTVAWNGAAVIAPTSAGIPIVDVGQWKGSVVPVTTVAGVPEVDVTHFGGNAGTILNGRPEVNTSHWRGNAVPATTVAGVPEVDVTHFNGVAGTFSAGRPEVNTSHWKGSAVSTPTVGGIPMVEVVDIHTTGQADIRTAVGLTNPDLDTQLAAISAAAIADAVWDEDATAHQTQGTFGQTIGDSALAGVSIYNKLGTPNNTIADDIFDITQDIPDAILDDANGIETGLTLREAMQGIAAVVMGKVSGAGTGTETFRNAVADTVNRIEVTVDEDGNRTAITYLLG